MSNFDEIIELKPENQTVATLNFLAEFYQTCADKPRMMSVLKLNSWRSISAVRRNRIFSQHAELEEMFEKIRQGGNFFPNLVDFFMENHHGAVFDSFLNLLSVLMSLLFTRRVLHPILQDRMVLTKLNLVGKKNHSLVRWLKYPIDDFTGEMKSRAELEEEFEVLWSEVKSVCWNNGMGEFGLSPARVLFGSRDRVRNFYEKITPKIRSEISHNCFMVSSSSVELFMDCLTMENAEDSLMVLPTEKNFEKQFENFFDRISFLSLHDYLTHHYGMLQAEAWGHLRSNFNDALAHFRAGSARMMTKIFSLQIVNVKRTSVSSDLPSAVRAEIGVDLGGLLPNVKAEWDQIRPGDVVFGTDGVLLRGFEVCEILDAQNNVVRPGSASVGDKRIFRVAMDPEQYASDVLNGILDYSVCNAVLRLGPSESNFKKSLQAVLHAIKANASLPDWLLDFFVGYGKCPSELTLVEAPPGAGVVDFLAEKISSKISQRTLIVAKSSEALNSILSAIEKHGALPEDLLKYGGAQEDNYSRTGRINYMLELRQSLLAQVKALAISIGLDPQLAEDYSYSCDAANQFFLNRITLMENSVFEIFYKKFQLEPNFSSISNIFSKISKCAPFEILRSVRDRSEYLFHCQAKIIGITSTGCALAAEEIRKTPFEKIYVFDASQMLDIETFVCLGPKCQELVLVGDENLLGPVLTSVSGGTQTLFARLNRLGAQPVQLKLNSTGEYSRAILNLFAWRYNAAVDNATDSGEVQFVNVKAYLGEGELEPSPYQFQNLGEAEFIVGLYMYLKLKGGNESIAILSPYNAQRNLILDVLHTKCQGNPMFPIPPVSTIDQFQGQVADIVLLSLVRTTTPGHIKDIRRLTVAFSRARHSLYIFGRYEVFRAIPGEIGQVFEYMTQGKGLNLKLANPDANIEGVEHMWKYLQNAMEIEIIKSSGK